MDQDIEYSKIRDKKEVIQGRCGLTNLGNTCYMNSGLQCLSNIPFFRQALLNLPKESITGITLELRQLFEQMWESESVIGDPSAFKRELGLVNPRFSGFSQEDTSEMLSFVLDAIHKQSVGKVSNKEPLETDPSDPPHVQLEKAWVHHYGPGRDSIVSKAFMGMFRSTVTCSECATESVTFEPFDMVSLPIPKPPAKIHFALLLQDSEPIQKSVTVGTASGTVGELLATLPELKGVPTGRLVIVRTVQMSYQHVSLESSVAELQPSYADLRLSVMEFSTPMEEDERLVVINRDYSTTVAVVAGKTMADVYAKYRGWAKANLDSIGFPMDDDIDAQLTLEQWNTLVKEDEDIPTSYRHTATLPTLTMRAAAHNPDLREALAQIEPLARPRASAPDVDDEGVTLLDCMDAEFGGDDLSGSNMWVCPTCKEARPATKRQQLVRTPPTLIFHLRRFDAGHGWGAKVDTFVDFPEHLSLDDLDGLIDGHRRYRLAAVSHHSGSLSFGHYTATGRQGEAWRYFNDSSVSETSISRAQSHDAFILMYEAV